MQRYIRAFWVALKMTLRGETVQLPYQRLRDWIAEGEPLIKAIESAAEQDGFIREQREQHQLKLDGRNTSVSTVLDAVRHHLLEEYPFLLNNLTDHSITAIYASNMNDQYFVARLRDDTILQQYVAFHAAIIRLSEHLNNIPPSTEI
jgi:hypothetical protein